MNTFSKLAISNGTATSDPFQWPGGRGVFEVGATWNGATIELQAMLPNGSYLAVGTDTTLTVNGRGGFDLPPCTMRVVVSGATPAAVYASVARVPS